MIGLYARVSTDKQNVKNQVNYLREYCLRENLSYRSYVDDAMSGLLVDRPAWQKLLRDCQAGKIKSILVMKFDRITRDLGYAIEFLEWLKKDYVKLVSLWDGGEFDFTDPDQEFNFKLNCLLSERELKLTKRRSRIGIDILKAKGGYKGRKKGSKNK